MKFKNWKPFYFKAKNIKVLIFCVFIFLNFQTIFSQTKISDSLATNSNFSSKIKERKAEYLDNKNFDRQQELFDLLDLKIQNANLLFKKGVDYKGFTQELEDISSIKKVIINGVVNNRKQILSSENLTLNSLSLNEILLRTNTELKELRNFRKKLTAMQTNIDSLFVNESLSEIPEDLENRKTYYYLSEKTEKNIDLLNLKFNTALDSISSLEISANKFTYELNNDILETEKSRRILFENSFNENYKIFKKTENPVGFFPAILYSLVKKAVLLVYYINNHSARLFFMFLITLALFAYVKLLKNKYQRSQSFNKFKYKIHIFEHPLNISILLSFSIFQFFLPLPPFSLLSISFI